MFKYSYLGMRSFFGKLVTEVGGDLERMGSSLCEDVAYKQVFSRHRNIANINTSKPEVSESSYYTPNCTILGDVHVSSFSTIGYNTTIRAEISPIRIGNYVSIGDHTIIHSWYFVPNGVPSTVYIGDHTVIGSGCSIASCIIDEQVNIGARTIVSEGVKIGKGAIIAPNSYIPPGRIIPEGTYWEGSPVTFVREVKEEEVYATYIKSYDSWVERNEHDKALNDEQLIERRSEEVKEYVSENYFGWRAKYSDI
eukprot:CAMPEP_0170515972 /NCGR_PEP_ID=MMETSP0209-20121228/2341_1 /TAXON_ID=665100 ORGANISM="Litonotus pictus, Strain P1" /NCGR_SAMPLE_ID=MMETSP0209 /ASSEMBLY_ACC=CAM_ASM_000301 /LENGTH=251 /DNA_ID=CAMNT_0010800707 /DNA_START=28 /DNA_END=783 /DNA_ORIENTATION=+